MLKFDPLRFIADHAGMALADAISEAYRQGQRDTESEIVRCKDCKHRRADTVYSYCEKLYRMGVLDIYCYMTSDDDFCSMAEREVKRNDAVGS